MYVLSTAVTNTNQIGIPPSYILGSLTVLWHPHQCKPRVTCPKTHPRSCLRKIDDDDNDDDKILLSAPSVAPSFIVTVLNSTAVNVSRQV